MASNSNSKNQSNIRLLRYTGDCVYIKSYCFALQGMKVACTHFQAAAGIFQHLKVWGFLYIWLLGYFVCSSLLKNFVFSTIIHIYIMHIKVQFSLLQFMVLKYHVN